MKITVREYNAFGNVLKHQRYFTLAKEIHNHVLELVDKGLTEFEIEEDTPEGKRMCFLIKGAETYLHYLEIVAKFEKGRVR